MKRNCLKFWLFFLCSVFVLSGIAHAEQKLRQSEPIHFEANEMEYSQKTQIITATGNVVANQSSYTFTSDFARYDMAKQSVIAWNNVRFKDKAGNLIGADEINYSATDGSAELLEGNGMFGPWLFATKKITRDAGGNFLLERAKLSACEPNFDRYHLFGYRVRVIPGKRLTVQNALFKIGKVPIFYFPYYYRSLGEKYLAFQFYPGQSNSEGFFTKTLWGYPFFENTYEKLYLDFMSKRGIGWGGELNYNNNDNVKGSLFAYRVEDQKTDRTRWNARLYHWQTFAKDWMMQIQSNKMSDDSFSNDFIRDDFDPIASELRSNFALTHTVRGQYWRLYAEQIENYNSNTNYFYTRDAIAPELSWTQTQTPIGWGGVQTEASVSVRDHFATFVDSQTIVRTDRLESDARVGLLRSFSLSRWTQVVPNFALTNRWLEKRFGEELPEKSVQRFVASTVLRQRLLGGTDLDLTHTFVQRFQNRSGSLNGRELHFLDFLLDSRPNRFFHHRLRSGLDLPIDNAQHYDLSDGKYYRPVSAEVTWTPKRKVEIFMRSDFTLYDANTHSSRIQTTQTDFTFGDRTLDQSYYSIGTSFQAENSNFFELHQSGVLKLTDWFSIQATLRSNFFFINQNAFNVKRLNIFDKELIANTQWRCWKLSLTFRERKDVFEFLFNVDLKLDSSRPSPSQDLSGSSEFYPWRQK